MAAFRARFLTPDDLASLIVLEQSKWEPDQAAGPDTLLQRILTYPALSVGAFCTRSGQAHASLFMKPIHPGVFAMPTRWIDAANCGGDAPCSTNSLFGISLSSRSGEAVNALFKFFFPHALKDGWRDIYIGSPIPGFKKACQRPPSLSAQQYANATSKRRPHEPLDPQLRYYFRKGFRQIISVQENYFPHADSLDHGVILRGVIPLSGARRLWRIIPLRLLKTLSVVL